MKLLVSLPILLLVPGYLILRVSRGGAPPAARLSRRGWLQAAALSLAATSWAGLVLLECGRFSLPALLAAMAAVSLLLLLVFRPRMRGGTPPPCGAVFDHRAVPSSTPGPCLRRDDRVQIPHGPGMLRAWLPLALVACAFAGACLWSGPSEHVFGGWDSGEYVSMGASFAAKGRIVYRDAFFASIPAGDRALFTEGGRRYMGFNLLGPDAATVSPKFMHLYPLWLALAMELSGLRAALFLNVLFTLLSIALCYRTALALGGRGAAFAAAGFMAASGIELWFSRAQCAEPLAQLFFLAAALFWALWQQGRGGAYAPLSAACLGMMFLTKVDALLVLPCAVAALLISERREGEGAFLLVLLAALLHLFAHMAWVDAPYARAVLANLPGPLRGRGAFLVPAALLAMPLCVPLAGRFGARPLTPARLPPAARCLAGAAALAAAVVLSLGSGTLSSFGTLLGTGILCLGLAGLASAWCDGVRTDRALPWCAAVGALAVFSVSLMGERGLYPWSARRFLPAAVPGLFLFAGCLAAGATTRAARAWRAVLIPGLAFIALDPLLKFPFLLTARDYPGAVEFLPRLAAATRGYDILLVEQTRLAVPLDFLCRRDVLLLKDAEQTAARCDRAEDLVGSWLAGGKRVAYVTSGPAVFGKRISFAEKAVCVLETSVLPLGRGVMPRGAAPAEVAVRVLEARPLAEEPPAAETRYRFGWNCFGLDHGFSGPRRARADGAVGRWTKPRAALILPWAGGVAGGEIAVAASARGAPAAVEVFVGETRVGSFDAAGPAREYAVIFPPGLLAGEKRARVEFKSDKGIFLERVTVRTGLEY